MKIFFEFETDEMPKNCFNCPVCYYETDDSGENLYCVLLSNIKTEQIEGYFTERRKDCPLKVRE